MTYPDNIQIVDSIDAVINTPWQPQTEAMCFPRRLKGDFDGVAMRLYNKGGQSVSKKELKALFSKIKFSLAERAALRHLIRDTEELDTVIDVLMPGSLRKKPFFLERDSIDRFHFDTNNLTEKREISRIMCFYTVAATEYKDKKGTTRQFNLGDVWMHFFVPKKDLRNGLKHRRPPLYWKSSTPRLSIEKQLNKEISFADAKL